jgi:hypothetical protein
VAQFSGFDSFAALALIRRDAFPGPPVSAFWAISAQGAPEAGALRSFVPVAAFSYQAHLIS